MRRLHIALLSLAIGLSMCGTTAFARGGGGHGGGGHGGGGGFHGGGGGGFHGSAVGGGFRGAAVGGGFRGGYGYGRGYGYGFRGYGFGYGGWGWGWGLGLGWYPWAYWPYWYGYGYPYADYGYPYPSYPYYGDDPCGAYSSYTCRTIPNGPASGAPAPAVAPGAAPRSQMNGGPGTLNAYVGDGQWHHFTPPAAPAQNAAAPPIQTNQPLPAYNAYVRTNP